MCVNTVRLLCLFVLFFSTCICVCIWILCFLAIQPVPWAFEPPRVSPRVAREAGLSQLVCSQPANLLRNCTPVLKRRVAISALSVWISVPRGAVPSLRAPLSGIHSLAPDSLPLRTQWALCTYIHCRCRTSLRIFCNYTRFHLSLPACSRLIGGKCNRIERNAVK